MRINELVTILNAANHAYYQQNSPIMSDFEYDKLYDELVELENETGIILADSPTKQVGFGYEVVSSLKKVAHDLPMLSLDKTKDPDALAGFLKEHTGLLSWKLDGVSIILKYENGVLTQAITRGNGTVGEDVTHNAKVFKNLPKIVPFKGKFSLRGEAVISFSDFEKINDLEEHPEGKYKNPRNLCSGAVRQLNSGIAAKRHVLFYVFELFPDADISFGLKSEQLEWARSQGFMVAHYEKVIASTVVGEVAKFKENVANESVATDGLVLTYDNIAFSQSLGATSKFPKDSIAFKWQDELAETTLIGIEWNTSRTGLINPIAIFEPVELEGTQVSRASLHNLSILRSLALKLGDRIMVYKANMIIPQVAENLSNSCVENSEKETELPPEHCPVCGSNTKIIGDPEMLYCINPNCGAQKIRSLSHFVSRDAMNIAGLSEQTLEKFVSSGIINDYTDIFNLFHHEKTIIAMESFGERSFSKLISAIETSKDVALPNFVYALGIRHVGLANAKLLCANFEHDAIKIVNACICENYLEHLLQIKGFGEAISYSLNEYFSDEKNISLFYKSLKLLRIKMPETSSNISLSGTTFVITGDVTKFQNRKALQEFIELNAGRVASSVSAKTTYLINNNAKSSSSKNKKALQLGVEILTEEDFLSKFFSNVNI